MRHPIVLAALLSSVAGADAVAQCLPTSVTPERSGTLVTITVDFCPAPPALPAPPAPAAPAASAAGAPAAAPVAPAAVTPPVAAASAVAAPAAAASAAPATAPAAVDLYGNWATLTAAPVAPPAAAPGAGPAARPDAGDITGAFESVRNILSAPETQELKGVRIDERDNVSIRLRHFNFVNFAAEYTVEKTVIEAYVTLNNLWSQALGLGRPLQAASVAVGPCPAGATFEQCVVDWMWASILASRRLNEATARHRSRVTLDQATIDGAVVPDSDAVQKLRAQLIQVQSDTLTRKPGSVQEIEWYNQVQASHDKLIGQIDAYLRLAELTVSGQTRNIDRQKAGTLVTVKVAGMNALGNPAGKPVEIQYFVHSKYPVTFHAGYLYSSLKEVEFDAVRTTAGADLFQQVRDPASVNSYAAFLSYQLWSGNVGRHGTGILATLGTDFKDPGERLYAGGSVRFLSRFYVGGGFVSATVSEGVNPVVEQVGTALGARELFDAVTTRRDWKPYFHVSFGVFN